MGEMKVMEEMNKGYLYALAAVVIWSGFILVSRMGGVSGLLPYDVIAIRYVTCAAILLPIWWFKYRFSLFDVRLIVASIVGGLAYALCVFRGFQLAPASHAAVLLPGLMPLFIILLSVLINREPQPGTKWFGVAVITFGVGVLFAEQFSQTQQLSSGHLWLAAAALLWALFSVLIKRWDITPWQATVSLAVVTSVLYLPVYWLWLPKAIAVDLWHDILLQAFYQGVLATIIQMIFYVKAVQYIGPSSMGAMMAIVPILSGVAALFVFDEPLTTSLTVGLLSVSIGAWLSHSRWFHRRLQRDWGKGVSPVVKS
ncbi:drug/metabolite transporter (DMT)-like permease [Sinobacterium caligoides]|uniref:Drug/metabolite transporter (DMT)-like permease n=1 Tax=Sinobacterium caligoides TaxID=933926 RepID=A0A3N2DNB0_9GAMM|nr:DMT family transporter [Sinobacterium caligoides]ROS01293.1 drug/metabolite transporter (DMT)-like permease [Sinobacterium caligoides]